MTDSTTTPSRRVGSLIPAIEVRVATGPESGAEATDCDRITIGTEPGNSIVLSDPTVSRYHLELTRRRDRIAVRDLGSTNGTFIGDVLIEDATSLVSVGTRLSIGSTELVLDNGSPIEDQAAPADPAGPVAFRSRIMRKNLVYLENLRDRNDNIVVTGESGLGKGEFIEHYVSRQWDLPVVRLHLGALRDDLSATISAALPPETKGLVLLEHVDKLNVNQQNELLIALDDVLSGWRLGSTATADLRPAVNHGTFLPALFFRLAAFTIEIPPLRHRPEDVVPLIERFLEVEGITESAAEFLGEDTLATLQSYPWPGNHRELQNAVSAAILTGSVPPLSNAPYSDGDTAFTAFEPGISYRDAKAKITAGFEVQYIKQLLEAAEGNVSKASRMAHMNRTYLIELIQRHGLAPR